MGTARIKSEFHSMTLPMSSGSDEIPNRPSTPNRSRTFSRKQLASLPSYRQSNYGDASAQQDEGIRERLVETETGRLRRKRHRSSQSSGFLLENGSLRKSPKQSDNGDVYSTSRDTTPSSSKGKGRALGRSPLGVDVMNTGDGITETTLPDARQQFSISRNGVRQKKRAIVSDTNQTQIVNLALNLSESRRRHFSSNRIPSLDTMNSRVPSSATVSPSPVIPYTGIVQLSSRFNSPKGTHNFGGPGYNSDSPSLQSSQSPISSNFEEDSPPRVVSMFNVNVEDFYPSEATLLRVHKAKVTLELCYEYRRLLQYLPRLPIAQINRPQSTKKQSSVDPFPTELGRAYNPLQYIRNRKIRRRENKPLNAEGQGWKNVEAVRQWVDDIVDESDLEIFTENNPFCLPRFPPSTNELETIIQPSNPEPGSTVVTHEGSKEGRPRVEWMVEPWNLLGDVYWQEQETHKQLIEDAKSQKIFPFTLSAPVDLRRDGTHSSAQRSISIPRSIDHQYNIVSDNERRDSAIIERGRKTNIRKHSRGSNRDYSGSRDRKPWHRFMRSQSSTDDSTSGRMRRDPRRRSQMDSREQQDRLILEKQIADLMARNPGKSNQFQVIGAGDTLTDDQSFPGLSFRPSSPEDDNRPQRVSLVMGQGKSSHLGLIERTREMQPRRFSTSLRIDDEVNSIVPNIAINVSPPRSRSRSARPLKNISTQHTVSDTEEPFRLSPKSAHRARQSLDSPREIKSQGSRVFESRLRGLLKGTKIVDIVSSPVAKVGDLIWKREQQGSDLLNSPTTSTHDPSDAEDSLLPRNAKQTEDQLRQANGKYQAADLPVFRSPFRGRQRGGSGESSKEHIVINASDTNSVRHINTDTRSKSNLRSAVPSPALSIVNSPEQMQHQLDSKEVIIETLASTQRRHAVTIMGETTEPTHLKTQQTQSIWPEKDRLQYLNVTRRLLAPLHRTITRKDIAALRAIAQCSLVVSSNINHQRQRTDHPPSKHSTSHAIHVSTQSQLRASQNLLQEVISQQTTVKSTITTLSQTTLPQIHSSLLDIETNISTTLTPTVRFAGDRADTLSAELSTTRTLEVKKLNDELDLIARRRRRKFRWLRRGLYWSLEWTLLGLMWWAWMIVVCFRLARGIVRGVGVVTRWLLWL